MAYQNINQYNFRRWGIKPVNEVTDICLASDEKDYDQEVVFSPLLIGENEGIVRLMRMLSYPRTIGIRQTLTRISVQLLLIYVMLV